MINAQPMNTNDNVNSAINDGNPTQNHAQPMSTNTAHINGEMNNSNDMQVQMTEMIKLNSESKA